MTESAVYHGALDHLAHWMTLPEQGLPSDRAAALANGIRDFHTYASKRFESRILLAISASPRSGHPKLGIRVDFLCPATTDSLPSEDEQDHLRTELSKRAPEDLLDQLALELSFVDTFRPPEGHFMGLHGLTEQEEAQVKGVIEGLGPVRIGDTLRGLFQAPAPPPQNRQQIYDLIQSLHGHSRDKDVVDKIRRLVS